MTTKAPFLFCRLCGVRFRSDQVAEHEKNCSYDSSKQSSKEIFVPVSSKDSGINELRDKAEYYKEEQPSAPEEKKETDPTSNEESKDSPLNLASKTENWGNEEEKKTVKFDNDVEVKGSKSDTKENNSKESHDKQKDESKPKDKSTDKKMSRSSSSKEKEEMESKPYPDEDTSEAVIRTPYPSEENIRMSGSSISGSAVDLPEFSDQAEMAYERHQKSLVPCSHCERQFRPDRLPIHQRACINRPKAREYIVPEEGEKQKEKKEEEKKKEEDKVKEEKERKGEEEDEKEEEKEKEA